MQTAIDQPTAETQKHEVPQNPFTDAIGTEMNTVHNGFWSYGCGTPYPETPQSQRRYDGDMPFEDCEPWM